MHLSLTDLTYSSKRRIDGRSVSAGSASDGFETEDDDEDEDDEGSSVWSEEAEADAALGGSSSDVPAPITLPTPPKGAIRDLKPKPNRGRNSRAKAAPKAVDPDAVDASAIDDPATRNRSKSDAEAAMTLASAALFAQSGGGSQASAAPPQPTVRGRHGRTASRLEMENQAAVLAGMAMAPPHPVAQDQEQAAAMSLSGLAGAASQQHATSSMPGGLGGLSEAAALASAAAAAASAESAGAALAALSAHTDNAALHSSSARDLAELGIPLDQAQLLVQASGSLPAKSETDDGAPAAKRPRRGTRNGA
jgi:hypothetical protein